jgi:hypothetical protein
MLSRTDAWGSTGFVTEREGGGSRVPIAVLRQILGLADIGPNSNQPCVNRGIVKCETENLKGSNAGFHKSIELDSRARKLVGRQRHQIHGKNDSTP